MIILMAELLPMLLAKSKERDTAMIPSNVARTSGHVTAGAIWLAVAILVSAGNTHAQVAGSSTVGVTRKG
jgi:hypothetical protein